jgi:hypothetical protein
MRSFVRNFINQFPDGLVPCRNGKMKRKEDLCENCCFIAFLMNQLKSDPERDVSFTDDLDLYESEYEIPAKKRSKSISCCFWN